MSVVEVTGPTVKRGRSCQTYGTPWDFIHAVTARWGALACDLAASSENAKAKCFYTEAEDSLAQTWAHAWPTKNLWLNPPFANIEPWAAKCKAEARDRDGLIFLLTPASIGTDWFANHVHGHALVLGISPRLTFEGTSDPYPKDLMLSIFGKATRGFDVWRWR